MIRYEDAEKTIYLRPITMEDTSMIVAWRNTDTVRSRFIFQETFTNEMHENWMRTRVATGQVVQMIICDATNDQPIGSVYLRDIDRHHNKAEYGIFLGEPDYFGKGFGTRAARLMLRYAFEELKLNRVYLRALADNPAAIRSYEKAGFCHEGILREDVCLNGKYKDVVWMAILREKE